MVGLCLLTFLRIAMALPAPRLLWKSENIYVDPISNYTAPQPIDRRIFGGYEVEPHSRPYQVALLINGRSLCGGSLISVNFVLTAAHCTTNASYVQMVFGAHNILAEEPTQVRVTSADIINHPDFNSRSLNNDIALIQTPRSIVTNSYIQTIDLVPSTVGTYVGYTVILTGWGTTSNSSSIPSGLHEVQLVVMHNSVCGKVYGTDFVKPTHLCTYGSGTVGGCNGDSGGPLIDGYYLKYQIGITSFISSNGCESGDPTGYTRISTFRPWIDANSDL
ncbi:hypothetical protein NQ315_011560 [Exocentrus adspersus]|uniref:Peptidase S1 domain-containing protein n=1 Tax=Exocentrus adspersus TaxID=1586481 RepID=A0AAV8VUQ7_9CUCU|nr:hypothetical protein NQ315_011560 [Exocentrus adspersus]